MDSALPYAVRVSSRSRHVSLKISLEHGLEVIVPHGYNPAHIPGILQRHRRWIERHQRQIEDHRQRGGPLPTRSLPNSILLSAIGESWNVTYQHTTVSRIRLQESGPGELVVHGPLHFKLKIRRALIRWLAQRCHETLLPRLRQTSQDYRLPFDQATVRLQKSRWASCSRRKTISLNLRLLFLPPHLVHHVFLHELSHTVHLNHSQRFWAFLTRLAPYTQDHRARLKTAWTFVPPWVA